MFKSSSCNDRPNDFLSLRYHHVVFSAAAAAAAGPHTAVSISDDKNRSNCVDFDSSFVSFILLNWDQNLWQIYHGIDTSSSKAVRANAQ